MLPEPDPDLDQTQPPRGAPRPRGHGETTRATPPPRDGDRSGGATGSGATGNGLGQGDEGTDSPSNGRDPDETRPMAAQPTNSTLGSFQIEEKIGEGGMGVVYRAYDSELHRRVAIKKILPKFIGDQDLAQRFISEARAVAAVDHPNISQIYSIHARDESTPPYFAMEFIEGVSADDLVAREGPLPLEQAVDIVLQAGRGLRAAQRRGIIHRDVKPSNLMITARGVVKLVDFGLSRPVNEAADNWESNRTEHGVMLGTPHYTSPEQARGWNVDHRSDIYALGCTLFYLLVGRPLFEGKSQVDVLMAHSNDPVPSLRKIRSDLPPKVTHVMQRMLEKQPERRYQNYDDLLEALTSLLPEEATAKPPSWRRHPMAMAILLLASVSLAIAMAPQFGRWLGEQRAQGEEFDPAAYFGDVYTAGTDGEPERLEYVFENFKRSMPSGISAPGRVSDLGDDPRVKLPGLLGKNLRWAKFEEQILFPRLESFQEVELSGLKFSGRPDFELVLGLEPEYPHTYLRMSFHVDRRTESNVVECVWSGELVPVTLETKKIDFTVKPNSEYIVRLRRGSEADPERTPFTMQLLLMQPTKNVLHQEVRFSVPTAALSPGHLALRCAGAADEDWVVYIAKVLIRGRLDHRRIAEDLRRGATFR